MPQILKVNHTWNTWKMYLQFYSQFFHDVSLWDKVFLGPSASCGDVITRFDHYGNWLQSLTLLLWAWVESHLLTLLFNDATFQFSLEWHSVWVKLMHYTSRLSVSQGLGVVKIMSRYFLSMMKKFGWSADLPTSRHDHVNHETKSIQGILGF